MINLQALKCVLWVSYYSKGTQISVFQSCKATNAFEKVFIGLFLFQTSLDIVYTYAIKRRKYNMKRDNLQVRKRNK